jgi:multiple sugar transport system substrate-binding protein
MRRTLAATAAIAILVIAGCGRDEDGGDAGAGPEAISDGPATGDITVWAMGTEGERLGELAAEFMAANPEANVEVTPVPWDAAHQKISTAIASGETPDVSMVGTTWMGEFAQTGALEQVPTDLIDQSAFFEGAWESGVVEGTSYGVPWYVETRLIFYRTDLAEEIGFSEAPQTWDELKEFARGMQEEAGAEWGINLQAGGPGSSANILPFAWSNGVELTSGDAFTMDTPEMVEALEYYQSFFTEGLSPTEALTDGALEQGFIDGSIGAFISGPWHVGILTDQGGEDFADSYSVARLPAQVSSTSFVGGSDLAVFSGSDNRDGAWKFVSWLSQPDVQVRWYEIVNDLPAVMSAWEDPALSGNPVVATFGEQLQDANSTPAIPTWEQVAAAIEVELERLCRADADPAETAAAMQQQADSIGFGTSS